MRHEPVRDAGGAGDGEVRRGAFAQVAGRALEEGSCGQGRAGSFEQLDAFG